MFSRDRESHLMKCENISLAMKSRTIDWNVTARMGHAYVKKYVEERELVMMLIVDMSASTTFRKYS